MFVGKQGNLNVFIANTKSEIENVVGLDFSEIIEVDFAEMYNGAIYTSHAELISAKQADIRQIRNQYLVEYVDAITCNPLRWNDMAEYEQQEIMDYRNYLLTYTEKEEWYEIAPLTFQEWM